MPDGLTQFPNRSLTLEHSLCPNASGGLFGRQAVVPAPGAALGNFSRATLLRLSRETDSYSKRPECLIVSVDTDVPDAGLPVPVLAPVGPVEMFLQVSWQTGHGTQKAEIDLLANGTSFAVAAADGLQVDVFRQGGVGTSQAPVTVRATAAFASGGIQAVPQRTVRCPALPMAAPIPIPKFAYRARMVPDVLGALAAPGGRLEWYTGPAVAPIGVVAAPVDFDGGRIPNGAQFFLVTGVAGTTVRAVFDLQLL